jgi:hypothetical protein
MNTCYMYVYILCHLNEYEHKKVGYKEQYFGTEQV